MTDQQLRVVEAMARWGGSFVKALAEAFYRADHTNFLRLKKAFPDYWKDYEVIAEQKHN